MTNFEKTADLGGRILVSAIFLLSGIGKVGAYAGTQAYMQSQGVPGVLLPLVIALEVAGAIAIIVGFRTRIAAAFLAGFSIVSAVLFHGGDDRVQSIMLMKNFAIAGGFLLLVARGAGTWSLDARRESLTAPGEPLRTRA